MVIIGVVKGISSHGFERRNALNLGQICNLISSLSWYSAFSVSVFFFLFIFGISLLYHLHFTIWIYVYILLNKIFQFFPEAKEVEFARKSAFGGSSLKLDYLTKPSFFEDFGFVEKVKMSDRVKPEDELFVVGYPYFNVNGSAPPPHTPSSPFSLASFPVWNLLWCLNFFWNCRNACSGWTL